MRKKHPIDVVPIEPISATGRTPKKCRALANKGRSDFWTMLQ
jgi:hypothetical protein